MAPFSCIPIKIRLYAHQISPWLIQRVGWGLQGEKPENSQTSSNRNDRLRCAECCWEQQSAEEAVFCLTTTSLFISKTESVFYSQREEQSFSLENSAAKSKVGVDLTTWYTFMLGRQMKTDEKRLCLTMVVLFVFFVSEKNPNTKLQNSIDSRRLWPLLVLQNSIRSCVCWSGWFSRYILVDIHTSCLSIMIIVLVVLDPIFYGRVVNLRNSLPDSVNYSSLPKIKCTVK